MVILVQLAAMLSIDWQCKSIDNIAALPKMADCRQLTSIQLGNDAIWRFSQRGLIAESCNSNMASGDNAV